MNTAGNRESEARINHSLPRTDGMDILTTLGIRERYRDNYWMKRDPIYTDRLSWRAHTFRHLVHLLPGQTILELGAGKGFFTQQLHLVSRGENPITSVSFDDIANPSTGLPSAIEYLNIENAPAASGRPAVRFHRGYGFAR
jgi:hypothetical protein